MLILLFLGAVLPVNTARQCLRDSDCDDQEPCTTEQCEDASCVYGFRYEEGCYPVNCYHDSTSWASNYGACDSYARGERNNDYCNDDTDQGEGSDTRLPYEACPVACREEWSKIPHHWCGDPNGIILDENVTLTECRDACRNHENCKVVEYWAGERGDKTCRICKDFERMEQYTTDFDRSFPVHLFLHVSLFEELCYPNTCVNGILDRPHDKCDDNNIINSDDCTNDCIIAECGDGILGFRRDEPEECDHAFNHNYTGVDCSKDCKISVCGDGRRDQTETCENMPPDGNSTLCSDVCEPIPKNIAECQPTVTGEFGDCGRFLGYAINNNATCASVWGCPYRNHDLFETERDCSTKCYPGFSAGDYCPGSRKRFEGVCGCHMMDWDVDGDGYLDCEDECPRMSSKHKEPCESDCGNCNEVRSGPGCNKEEISKCVEQKDPFCTAMVWEQGCVEAAAEFCGC